MDKIIKDSKQISYDYQAASPHLWVLTTPNEHPDYTTKNKINTNKLQPIYTRETKSAINLASKSYIPMTFDRQHYEPQDPRHIIFEGAAQRGGVNTSNVIKNAWESNLCDTFIKYDRGCGKFCSEVNGYMTKSTDNAIWGSTKFGSSKPEPVTSQMSISLGSSRSFHGPQFIYNNFPVVNDPYDRFPSTISPVTGKFFDIEKTKNVF